jgi:membrane-bound lytic murein transglycosylase F
MILMSAKTILLGLLLTATAAACDRGAEPRPDPVERDWAEIQAYDTLVVLTMTNSTTYFLYRGEPMGFEYELLQRFASDHDVHLRLEVSQDTLELFHQLNLGGGDLVAARLVPRMIDEEWIAFTEELYRTPPVLVQRTAPPSELDLPEVVDTVIGSETVAAPSREPQQIPVRLVSEPGQLADATVHVGSHSAYYDRLIEIQDSITGDIQIVEVEGAANEALIRQVARGEIELTIAPENVADLRREYYTNITVQPVIGPEYRVAWAVRQNAPELLGALNAWLAEQHASGVVEQLYRKYFIDRRGYQARHEAEYLTEPTAQLSQYDDLLRQHAPEIGWDWRLLAAQTMQESRFDPRARSWAGAQGLLQLMPGTAREVGVGNVWDPEQNVRGGVRYLAGLIRTWTPDIPDEDERLKFVLASYNVGRGHVLDAQRLTEKHGGNPLVWDEVAYWLLQKSKREVYSDPVVRHGYARGLEPVTYVAKILDRWAHYRQLVTDPAVPGAPR